MKKLIIVFACLLSAGLVLAVSASETVTPTTTETVTATSTATFTVTPTTTETIVASETMTSTITDTNTQTFTNSPTSTITPTFTVTPTPQGKAFAFPNPAKNTKEIGFAYPLYENNIENPDKKVQFVTIIVKAVNGEEAGRAYDPSPNGYTYVDISKYARGIYLYQIILRYPDGTEKKFPLDKFGKFAVIK
jgi:hypothetical protein